ncbi:MAG: hypothetical protein H3C31_10525 [Brumimicrobium sp.]|nr:hypothetical protein [Brumimicrobium sp.]
MEFYKKRDFGQIIGDTFTFFKEYGRNFILNYLTINGGIILLLLITVVLGYGEIISQLFGGNISGETYYFQQYYNDNQMMLIFTSIILFLLLLLLMLFTFSFPVFYIKIVSETGNKKVTTSEIIDHFKGNFKRLLLFYLGTIFIVTPIFFAATLLSAFLIIIMIGLFLFIMLIPVMLNIVNFSLFDTLIGGNSYFKALITAFKMQFSRRFWKYMGATLVIYLIIYVISMLFTLIPILIFGFSIFTVAGGAQDDSTVMVILILVMYFISIIFSFIVFNAFYISAGWMYFDSREDLQGEASISEIDQMGL